MINKATRRRREPIPTAPHHAHLTDKDYISEVGQTRSVPWSLLLPVELLDRRYDKYRDAIAAVDDASGNAVGYLVTYAREQDRFEGFSRLRPKWRPTERIVGWFVPTQGRADEEYLQIDDLESGTWGADKLRWLQGSERDAAWRRYVDEWGPHDDSSRLDNRDEPVVSPSLDRDAARNRACCIWCSRPVATPTRSRCSRKPAAPSKPST